MDIDTEIEKLVTSLNYIEDARMHLLTTKSSLSVRYAVSKLDQVIFTIKFRINRHKAVRSNRVKPCKDL